MAEYLVGGQGYTAFERSKSHRRVNAILETRSKTSDTMSPSRSFSDWRNPHREWMSEPLFPGTKLA